MKKFNKADEALFIVKEKTKFVLNQIESKEIDLDSLCSIQNELNDAIRLLEVAINNFKG